MDRSKSLGSLRRGGAAFAVSFACAWGISLGLGRADVVHLSSASNPQARSRLRGKVLEYTGREIVVETEDGREVKRASRQVVEIETEWPPGVDAGDERYEAGDFKQARDQYVAAIRQEQRAWARRKILAKIIDCYKQLGEFESAGKLFLGLVREDPDTPDFERIPLAWAPAQPQGDLERAAEQWLASPDAPVAVLLGASHLLPTSRRAGALERLELLARDKDRRIAALAQAQTWRGALATANEERIERWKKNLAEFPEALRAGPYLVLGQAMARKGDAEQAALTLLHVPILYPQDRLLASQALAESAALLEKLGQEPAAARLYQELASQYAGTRAAVEAAGRLGQAAAPKAAFARPATAPDEPLEARFLEGLRSRRLFELAEAYCRSAASEPGLSHVRQAELAVELSRTFADHALQVVPDERDALWAQALGVVEELLRREPKHPRRVLLEVQRGLVRLARGELARQEAEISGGAKVRLEQAREELRAAVSAFETAQQTLAEDLRRANLSKRPDPERLPGAELQSLARHLNYQLARAFRNQGQSYPAGSEDRTNSLGQAVERLKPLAQADEDDDAAWQSRLDEIICERLLEDQRAASLLLESLDQLDPPPRIQLSARAEAIRLALDRGQARQALVLMEAGRTVSGWHSPDLDYAFLEAYVAAWRAAGKAGDEEQATKLQSQAAELIRAIDRLYGPYWSRRAETLLAGNISEAGGSKDLTLLVRAAESLYRAGQFERAVAAYDQAAEQAAAAKDDETAFDAAYTAAVLEQEQGRNGAAAERFRRLALSQPKRAKAGDAHLLAIYNTAQAAKRDPAARFPEGAGPDGYAKLLEEHLQHWAGEKSANQARIWLGKLREREQAWSAAIAAYRDIPADDPRFAEAVSAIARSQQKLLSELAATGKPTRDAAEQAARYFEQLVVGDRNRLPERWTPVQREAAASAAEIWLHYADDQFDRAERILAAALDAADEAPEAWRSQAEGLLVFALAGQGRRDEAARRLAKLAQGRPQQLLLLVEGLGRIARKASPAVRRELAELELQAAGLLRDGRKDLSEADRKIFDLAYGRALVAARRRDEALKLLAGMAEAAPRDGQIQEAYAQLLLDGADKASWQAALGKWRQIEKKCRPGSDRWLRSIYHQALALERLGQKSQAARLLKLTQALHPELGGPELKAQFVELLRRCER
ncbi:MAG TPA: hypothetical protein VMV10_08615 [Pirellulales bacterium]|nr:hypothetical protein [Pirellulales bacterium]